MIICFLILEADRQAHKVVYLKVVHKIIKQTVYTLIRQCKQLWYQECYLLSWCCKTWYGYFYGPQYTQMVYLLVYTQFSSPMASIIIIFVDIPSSQVFNTHLN